MSRLKVNVAQKIRKYDENNLACARIILANQGGYGGEDALPVIWARTVIKRLEKQTTDRESIK